MSATFLMCLRGGRMCEERELSDTDVARHMLRYGGHGVHGGRDVFSGQERSGQSAGLHSSNGRSQENGKFGSSSRVARDARTQQPAESSSLPLGSQPNGAQMFNPGMMMGVPGGGYCIASAVLDTCRDSYIPPTQVCPR